MKTVRFHLLIWSLLCSCPVLGRAQGSAFTYQGMLRDQAAPATGLYDFRFNLFSTNAGGSALTGAVDANDIAVSNGLFVATLDFGGGAFDGSARWLEIAVRPGASAGAYTNLTPRQPLQATPYAVRAANFSGLVGDSQLSANVARLNAAAVFTGSVSFSNANGTFSGNGAGLRHIDLPANSGGAISPLGGFALVSTLPAGPGPVSIAAGDMNGDGTVDFVCVNYTTNKLTVLTNNGAGGFAAAGTPTVGDAPISVTSADLNGDGKLDLISANFSSGTLSVLTNKGAGVLLLAATIPVDDSPTSVIAADVNADGKLDLICASFSSNRLSVLTN